jgi:hypothetical protein
LDDEDLCQLNEVREDLIRAVRDIDRITAAQLTLVGAPK